MIENIFEIEKESFSKPFDIEELREMAENKEYIIVKDEEGGEIKSYLILLKMVDVIEIIRIAVPKKYRGKGYGKKILKKAVDISKKLGYNSIWLEVREGNKPARELYKSEGFKEIHLRKRYYSDNGENAIVMELKI